jgi:hypothetical protein
MFHRADGESSENIPEAYETSDNEAGVGFDDWASVERRKDRSRRTPLRISSKYDSLSWCNPIRKGVGY